MVRRNDSRSKSIARREGRARFRVEEKRGEEEEEGRGGEEEGGGGEESIERKENRIPFPNGTNSFDTGISAFERVTLAVIRRRGRDFARDRNIHPRGRNGWRTQLPGSFLTGGPCGSPSLSLSLSPFLRLSFMLSISFDPPFLPVSFLLSHWRSRDTYGFLVCSLFLSLSLGAHGHDGHDHDDGHDVSRTLVRRLLLLATFALFLLFPFLPLSLASAGNSERRSPRRIAREHGIPLLRCPVILKNTPAK